MKKIVLPLIIVLIIGLFTAQQPIDVDEYYITLKPSKVEENTNTGIIRITYKSPSTGEQRVLEIDKKWLNSPPLVVTIDVDITNKSENGFIVTIRNSGPDFRYHLSVTKKGSRQPIKSGFMAMLDLTNQLSPSEYLVEASAYNLNNNNRAGYTSVNVQLTETELVATYRQGPLSADMTTRTVTITVQLDEPNTEIDLFLLELDGKEQVCTGNSKILQLTPGSTQRGTVTVEKYGRRISAPIQIFVTDLEEPKITINSVDGYFDLKGRMLEKTFKAATNRPDEIPLTDLTWSVDDISVGTGPELTTALSPGNHVIKASYNNYIEPKNVFIPEPRLDLKIKEGKKYGRQQVITISTDFNVKVKNLVPKNFGIQVQGKQLVNAISFSGFYGPGTYSVTATYTEPGVTIAPVSDQFTVMFPVFDVELMLQLEGGFQPSKTNRWPGKFSGKAWLLFKKNFDISLSGDANADAVVTNTAVNLTVKTGLLSDSDGNIAKILEPIELKGPMERKDRSLSGILEGEAKVEVVAGKLKGTALIIPLSTAIEYSITEDGDLDEKIPLILMGGIKFEGPPPPPPEEEEEEEEQDQVKKDPPKHPQKPEPKYAWKQKTKRDSVLVLFVNWKTSLLKLTNVKSKNYEHLVIYFNTANKEITRIHFYWHKDTTTVNNGFSSPPVKPYQDTVFAMF